MDKKVLDKILEEHEKWLKSCGKIGKRADLSDAHLCVANLKGANLKGADLSYAYLCDADLSGADLSGADLHFADFSGANLCGADISDANLESADISGANLEGANLHLADLSDANISYADLSGANLSGADISEANLRETNFSGADLHYANLSGATIRDTNFSGAKNLLNAIDFLNSHFEKAAEGYIVYKTFGSQYKPNPKWKIKPNSIIEENVNHTRTQSYGCGINVAPLEWVKNNSRGTIYKLLIKYEWLSEVCVPYNPIGEIRCGRAMIIEKVNFD